MGEEADASAHDDSDHAGDEEDEEVGGDTTLETVPASESVSQRVQTHCEMLAVVPFLLLVD